MTLTVLRVATCAALLALAVRAEAQPAAERLPVCLACHGASGTSAVEGVPSLGAQLPDYLLAQLYMFREKQRVAAPMNDMAAGLSDDELQILSTTLAQLPPPAPGAAPLDPATAEQARALVSAYRCNSCHGADLAGQDQIPRIAGQREEYLLKSLTEYKSNARAGYNPAMNESSQEIRDADIPLLARYLAQYR